MWGPLFCLTQIIRKVCAVHPTLKQATKVYKMRQKNSKDEQEKFVKGVSIEYFFWGESLMSVLFL